MEVFHTSPEFEAFKGTINDSEIYTDRAIYLTGFVSSNVITILKINPTCKNCKIDIYARIELLNSEKFPENPQKNSGEGQNFVFQLQSKIGQRKPENSEDEMFPAGEATQEFLTIITFGEIYLKNFNTSTMNPDERQKFLGDQKSPVLTYVAVGSLSGLIHILVIFETGHINFLSTLHGHVNEIKVLKHYKEDYLISGSLDGLVILWNVTKNVQVVGWVPTYKTPSSVFDLDLHPTRKYFCVLTMEGDVKIIKITDEV
jgi:WD40 repeat protein